ncbi:MAG TPA: class I SAM-dependent RNA methyltransferase [Candidatus Limnocylindrales bacterium]|nr:class I SAM-dependent RNA methyltransferase [Candidatus Limnocylindrales bacterium]
MEKLVYGGDGLARLDGRVVFAPFVLPGERVRVRSELEKPGLVKASLAAVEQPSAERVPAPCPYFGRCGGCHYQHAGYDFQLSAKRQILVEELRRLGKVEPPSDIAIVAAEPWGYRNRAQLHIEDGRLGYREARSHKLCAIDRCPISSPRVNETIAIINGMLRDSRWPRFVRGIEVFTDEQSVQLNVLETDRPVARRFFEWCTEKIPGMVENALDYEGRYRVSRNSFFQVNRFLLDKLVAAATAGASGDSALDLYAGVGLFSMALARSFGKVTAVESGSTAVRDLLFNAERAGLGNVSATAATTEAYLEKLETPPDLVLLDPPRAGAGKIVVRRLAELKPRWVTVVSCDPATLARDLSGLLAAGYRIADMLLVDLFPQTYHLETVVRLEYAG